MKFVIIGGSGLIGSNVCKNQSVVGTERMLDSGYFRAKMAQEKLIKASGVPYTILRATQFFEFIGAIAYSGREDGNTIHLSSAALQPVANDKSLTPGDNPIVGATQFQDWLNTSHPS